jgi:hypothetical protein
MRVRRNYDCVNITWRMQTACWAANTTDTHSEYLVLKRFCTATMITRKRVNNTFTCTVPLLLNVKLDCA